jgi:Tol biopolymer transport system component
MLKLKINALILIIIISVFLNIILIFYVLKSNNKNYNSNDKVKDYNVSIYKNDKENSYKKTIKSNDLKSDKMIYQGINENQNKESQDKNTSSNLENKRKIMQEFYNLLGKKNESISKNSNKVNVSIKYNIAFTTNENGYNEIVLGYLDKYSYKINVYSKIDMGNSDSVFPCFSNKGDRLAFFSNKEGNYNLYIYDFKSNDIQKITNFYSEDDRYNYYPKWDFNDEKIFFVNIKKDFIYLKYTGSTLDKKPILKFVDLRNKQVYELLNGVFSFCFIDYNTLLVSYTNLYDINLNSDSSSSYYYYNLLSLNKGIYKVFVNENEAIVMGSSIEDDLVSCMGINPSKTMFIYPKNDKLFIASIDILKDEKTNSYIRIKKEIPVVLNDIESLQFIDSENIILSCRNSGNYDLYLLNIQTLKLIKLTDSIYDENSPTFK